MCAAKFCTDCSLQIFLFEVFDHTVEQYSNLLKTRAFITVTSWLRSRTCLTRLICARLDIQDDVVFRTWSSNVSCGSKTTPRSLAEDVRARSFPRRDILKSGSLASSCRLYDASWGQSDCSESKTSWQKRQHCLTEKLSNPVCLKRIFTAYILGALVIYD